MPKLAMATHPEHRFTLADPIWFRIYGTVLIALAILWSIYLGLTHHFHRHDLPPSSMLGCIGSGFVSHSRFFIVSSSAVFALSGTVFAIIARPYEHCSDVACVCAILIVCLFPVILCIRQWRTLA